MTTFKAALRSALTEAVGIPQTARGGSVAPHKPRHGSIARVSGGELVELLKRFEAGRTYTEPEVNALLRQLSLIHISEPTRPY